MLSNEVTLILVLLKQKPLLRVTVESIDKNLNSHDKLKLKKIGHP